MGHEDYEQAKSRLNREPSWIERKIEAWEASDDVGWLRAQVKDLGEEYDALQKRYDTLLRDCGTTLTACPECGHGMSSRDGCLKCRLADAEEAREDAEAREVTIREALEEALQWIVAPSHVEDKIRDTLSHTKEG